MTEAEFQKLAVQQVKFIAINGCNMFKCKLCVLNKMCDRTPSKSKEVARKVLEDAYRISQKRNERANTEANK